MKHIASGLQEKQEGAAKRRRPGTYAVRRGRLLVSGFGSFHEAYRYGLNTFCSQDFLVQKQGVPAPRRGRAHAPRRGTRRGPRSERPPSEFLQVFQPDGEAEAASRHIVEICQTPGIERVAWVGSPSLVSALKVRKGISRISQIEPFRFVLLTFYTREEA